MDGIRWSRNDRNETITDVTLIGMHVRLYYYTTGTQSHLFVTFPDSITTRGTTYVSHNSCTSAQKSTTFARAFNKSAELEISNNGRNVIKINRRQSIAAAAATSDAYECV